MAQQSGGEAEVDLEAVALKTQLDVIRSVKEFGRASRLSMLGPLRVTG